MDATSVSAVLAFSFAAVAGFLVVLPGGTNLADGQTVLGQFGVQAIGVVAVAIWSLVATFIIVKLCEKTVGLRVDEQCEIEGLDYTSHGETGYNL